MRRRTRGAQGTRLRLWRLLDAARDVRHRFVARGVLAQMATTAVGDRLSAVIAGSVVFDSDDHPHRLDEFFDLEQNRSAVFIFLRHFLDYIAVQYAQDLAKVPQTLLAENNVRIVPIGCAPVKFVREFEDLTKITVYTDPERVIFTNLELLKEADVWNAGSMSSPHVKSSVFGGAVWSGWRALQHPLEYQGDHEQQGGALVVGADGRVRYFHRDRSPFDHARIVDLLASVGISLPVDFFS